ncbi:MAG: ABC transporter permease [Candidatus Lokiarchaeota archaeon]|nr:ABC transporter permease [Candidatus Lokiarchaeota archaeon]
MDFLLKKAYRDFNKLGWRKYLILGVISLCIGGSLAINYTISASLPMIDSYFNSANHADYTYQFNDNSWINSSQFNEIKNIPEIDKCTGRLIWSTSIKLAGQQDWKYVLLIGLNSTIDSPEVYKYFIRSGENFNQGSNNLSAVIDNSFFEKNQLELNQILNITSLNNASVQITGTFNSPEFLLPVSNPEFILPLEGSMGIIYLPQKTLKTYIIDHYTYLNNTTPVNYDSQILYLNLIDYNNIALTFKEDISLKNGDIAVQDYIKNNMGLDIYEAKNFYESFPYSYIKADLGESSEFMWIIQIFIALTGILVIYVVFNRYTHTQKQQTGILEALGYSKKQIYQYYSIIMIIIYSISIPIGIMIGFSIGYIMINVLLTEMANMHFFEFGFLFLPEVMYIGLITGGLIIFLSVYLPVRKIAKKDTSKLIYQKLELKYKKKQKIRFNRNNIKKISQKLPFKNAFRNKKRIVFSLLAITFSLLIVTSTQCMLDSMFSNIDTTFNNPNASGNPPVENWDLNVQFQDSVNKSYFDSLVDKIENIIGIQNSLVYTKGIGIAEGKENRSLLIIGMDLNNSNIHNFKWKTKIREDIYPLADNEIIISSVEATKLGKNIGDILIIRNSTDQITSLEIVGIHRDLTLITYISETLGKILFHSSINLVDGIYLSLDSGADKENVKEQIYNLGNIEVIFDSEEMGKASTDYIENFFSVFYVLIYYTLAVVLIILIYNSIMNIYDKNYEFGILRSLGYSKRNIGKMIFIENLIQTTIPIILTLIFTYPLSFELMSIYESNFPLDVSFGPLTIIFAIIPALLMSILGSFIALRVVYKKTLYEQVQTSYVG